MVMDLWPRFFGPTMYITNYLNQISECNRLARAHPLHDFNDILRFCVESHYSSIVKNWIESFRGFYNYGGLNWRESGNPQIHSAP